MYKLSSLVRFPLNHPSLFLFLFGFCVVFGGFVILLLNQPHSSEEAFLVELLLGIIFMMTSGFMRLLKRSRFSVLGKIVITFILSILIVGITFPILFGGLRSDILNSQIRKASLGCREGADCVSISGSDSCVFTCGPRLVRREKYDQLIILIRATSWMKDGMCTASCPTSHPGVSLIRPME